MEEDVRYANAFVLIVATFGRTLVYIYQGHFTICLAQETGQDFLFLFLLLSLSITTLLGLQSVLINLVHPGIDWNRGRRLPTLKEPLHLPNPDRMRTLQLDAQQSIPHR